MHKEGRHKKFIAFCEREAQNGKFHRWAHRVNKPIIIRLPIVLNFCFDIFSSEKRNEKKKFHCGKMMLDDVKKKEK